MALFDVLVDIAADTAKLEEGLQRAQTKVESFADTVKSVAKTIGEFEGVKWIVEFTDHLIDVGAELEHAAVRAGVGGQAFSELSYAAKQSGVGTDQLAGALSKMNRAMSEASEGAQKPTQALAALGLTFDQLQTLRPEQQLEVIADRISRLPTPADKARAAIDLFGKSGAELLPLLEKGAQGIEKLRQEARDLGASFSDETLKALEGAHQSIQRMETSAGALATTLTAKLAPSLRVFLDTVTAAATGDATLKLQAQLERLQIAVGQGTGFLSLSRESGLGGIGYHTASTTRDLRDLLEARLGIMNDINQTVANFEQPDMAKLLGGAAPGYGATHDPMDDLHQLHIRGQKDYQDKMTALFERFQRDTETADERQEREEREKMAQLEELRQQDLISEQQYQERKANILLHPVEVHAKKVKDPAKQAMDEMQGYADTAARNIQGAFANFLFDPFHGGLKRMAVEFLAALQRMAAEAAAAKIFQALFGKQGSDQAGAAGSGGLGGILGSVLSSVFEGKAGGGYVSAGSTYLVGEQGPELFTASASGNITPNGALGSSVNIHTGDLNVDARGSDEAASARLAATLPSLFAAHQAQTTAKVLQAFRRAGLAAPART